MELKHIANSKNCELVIEDFSEHKDLVTGIRPNTLFRGFSLAMKLAEGLEPGFSYPKTLELTPREVRKLDARGLLANCVTTD
jgi:hypothetical protein